MYARIAGKNANNVRTAFATIAALLHLTSYRYPILETVCDGATYDYVIVGAGTAGSVIANRLSEDPSINVLLIEAGGDPSLVSEFPALPVYTTETRMDWKYTSQRSFAFQCVENNQLQMHQGRTLGGCTSVNDMFYVRGDPNDYNIWAAITGDDSWNYTNVLPYFMKSERLEVPSILNSPFRKYHGSDGYVGITEKDSNKSQQYLKSLKELGYNIFIDINSAIPTGIGQAVFTIANSIRQSTANTFLSVGKDRPNLHVMKESIAQKIEIDENKRATGVIVTDTNTGKTITVKANKEVVLSAGSISNPRILMKSGIGPKHKLDKLDINVVADLPVGEALQTHTPLILMVKTSKPNPTKPINPHIFPVPVVNGGAALNASQSYADYQLTIASVNGEVAVSFCSELYGFKDEIFR